MSENFYTIYQHPKITKSGPCRRWYYYYYDQNGKKIQKACRGCKTKEESETYIKNLPTPANYKTSSNLIKDIAGPMFLPGSDHMERRMQLGKSTYQGTVKESRRFINLIISLWGNVELPKLHPEIVMAHLFSVKKSGKWKNKLIEVLYEIYSEAPWYKCRAKKPTLERFNSRSKKADALYPQEVAKLFNPINFPSRQFYLMFLLSLAGGLRLGEARAVKAKQIIFDRHLIIIDGFIQQDGTRTNYTKKGSPEHPRHRIVYLNNTVLDQLRQWIIRNSLQPEDYCFTFNNKIIRQELAENVFYKALQNAKIIPPNEPRPRNKRGQGRQKQIKKKIKPLDNRKLVPHSLRYTYVSMMLQHVTKNSLMPMTGHTSEVMVDYYHKKVLDMTIASLPQDLREATNKMIAWEELKKDQHPEIRQLELFPA